MTAPPAFMSMREYVSRLGDVGFWRPYIAEILARHGLTGTGRNLAAGYNATFPTFVTDNIALKLFGYFGAWHESHRSERAAHALIATDPKIVAPRLLANGSLIENVEADWPYLMSERVSGVPWWRADLSATQDISVAFDVGRQVQRVHRLRSSEETANGTGQASEIVAAARHSSLPSHLIEQIEEYLARLGPFDRVFVHGDLVDNHVYVRNGRLAGIIDWGDATMTDRHYEIAKLYFGAFDCNKDLLRVFLDASEWPVAEDFAFKALGLALRRQASGLAQHFTFDVFHTLFASNRLKGIGTLDDLAIELFAV